MSGADYWVVIPAAGSSRRLGGEIRKQYLHIGNKTILEHAVHATRSHRDSAGVVVAIAADDDLWPDIDVRLPLPVRTVTGGATRARSVLAGLEHLADFCAHDQLVLVHDAARPCLSRQDLRQLLTVATGELDGAVLAVAMTDTVKRVADGRVAQTLPREDLVRAVTPQAFRLGALRSAIEAALAAGVEPTDECAAMERVGYRPRVVLGSSDNIKVTFPGDLEHAERILAQRIPSA